MPHLRDELTVEILANEIRMLRAGFGGTILVLEGETDEALLNGFVCARHCEITIAHGKSRVFAVIALLELSVHGLVGIVDADFDRLDRSLPGPQNILKFDCHDLEMMVFGSNALEKVLKVRASRDKVERFERENGASLRDVVISAGVRVGALRWVSANRKLRLEFRRNQVQ